MVQGNELLARVGECLYGEHWTGSMARELGINVRTVQRWANGQNEVSEHVWRSLMPLLLTKRHEAAELDSLMIKRLAADLNAVAD